ncbi:hypothetical protein [Vreelandella alkaliphila]|uniref:Uncharacterized protein n=1 Tax=Vreelandella alkaliphila TaxID=272774 RepID=A0AAJ2S5A3_9GAMM|nr:hypothetical protein [Halomonas alkaliphila]MDX5979640.1 hypothetical protein [Halomonas alkaliphila]
MQMPLVQRLMVNGQALDISLFHKVAYVEVLDLSGPRLLLQATDSERVLRDDFGVIEGALLAAELDDTGLGGGLSISEAFVIKTVDSDANDNLSIECMAAPVDALKTPAKSAMFLNIKSMQELLSEATGLALDVGNFPLVDAWHLLPGERPSKALRQLAREFGAALWYSRGILHMHPLDDLWSKPVVKTLHHDDPRKPRLDMIDDYALTYRSGMIEDRVKRGYGGWTMTEGVIGGGAEFEATPHHRSDVLGNLSKTPIPAIDLLLYGQGVLKPRDRLELKFHRSREGCPFDESIPPEIMIHTVSSQQEKDQYRTRIKGVILNG